MLTSPFSSLERRPWTPLLTRSFTFAAAGLRGLVNFLGLREAAKFTVCFGAGGWPENWAGRRCPPRERGCRSTARVDAVLMTSDRLVHCTLPGARAICKRRASSEMPLMNPLMTKGSVNDMPAVVMS
jgi:hypothetical protein